MDFDVIVKSVLEMSPPVALVAALYAMGMLIRKIEKIPSWLAPVLTVIVGTVVYPMIADRAGVSHNIRNPEIFNWIIGFLLGCVPAGAYEAFMALKNRGKEPPPEPPKQ